MGHTLKRGTPALVVAIAVGAVLAASCSRIFSSNAGSITKNPADFNGTTVTVSGKVTERYDLPGLKCYVLDDGTGTIGVVTQGALPQIGDKVRAHGRVDASFKLGKRALVAVIEPGQPPTPKPKPAGKAPDRIPG